MKNEIIELSKASYIDEIRFIDAENLTDAYIGDERKFAGRQPADIMPNARTVIIASIYIGGFVTRYQPGYGRISRLVLAGYYANIVKPLIPIKDYLVSSGYDAIIIDGESTKKSIPLKGAAVKAGLGWIGKNSLLVNDKYGSFLALGAILTNADIAEAYPVMKNLCGSCSKCIDICPSKAIETPQLLSRPRCLSDILDKYDSGLDLLEKADMDGYFFECDICQNACSWNQKHIRAPLDTPYGRLFNSAKLDDILKLDHLKNMDEQTYEKQLVPLMIGYKLPYKTFQRNIAKLA